MDESKFNLFGSDGKHYVRRQTGERLNPKCIKKSVKLGRGHVMVYVHYLKYNGKLLLYSIILAPSSSIFSEMAKDSFSDVECKVPQPTSIQQIMQKYLKKINPIWVAGE